MCIEIKHDIIIVVYFEQVQPKMYSEINISGHNIQSIKLF